MSINFTWLRGKKTYLLSFLGLVFAVSGYLTGHLDSKTSIEMIWAALTSATLRAGISSTK